jgi:CheY-like chemotaxis protein
MIADVGHLILLVEDDPVAAARASELLRGAGHRVRVATNVKQALAVLEVEDPCALVFDHELPFQDDVDPQRASGRFLLEAARKQATRFREATLFFLRQILVLTGVSNHADFVSEMHHLGATHFHNKPLGQESGEIFVGKVRVCLERAGRVQHADCARLVRPRVAAAKPVVGPRVRIDGTKVRARMVLCVDDAPETMQESAMLSLLRAIVVHERSPGTWSARAYLYIGRSNNATTRIREPFKKHVAEGFQVIEADWDGNYRLNPAVVIERVEWGVLAEHPNAQIRKLAKEQRERAERAR